MPLVSIIIASYNHQEYITEAIQSVLDQTFQDFEIVIVDDASTDGTVKEIRKFNDSRIKLFCSEKNEGQFATVRKGIEISSGKYIAILNSDDAFFPEKLEKQVHFLDENPSFGAVFSYAQLIDDDGNFFFNRNHFYNNVFVQHNRSRYEWLNFFFFKGNCFIHPSILIRKECHNILGNYKEHFTQISDYEFWVRLCFKWEIYIIQENLTKFRIRKNEANLSGNKPESIKRYAFELLQLLKNYLSISDASEFFRIFPEGREDFQGSIDTELIPFYVCMMALKVDSPIYQLFALETLSELFNKRETVEKLAEKCGFSYVDFIRLTGKFDPLNYINYHYRAIKNKKLKNNIIVKYLIPQNSMRSRVAKYLLKGKKK
jgi:glycosyltransferase involved in cell wall biosynthesis